MAGRKKVKGERKSGDSRAEENENENIAMEAKKKKSQSTASKCDFKKRRGEERKGGSGNPISATLAVVAVCLHALACGLQMSLIPADSSCEFLMPGSHTFFPGRSQAASACICDSSPNPTPFPCPCHIQKPNWTQAYVSAEPFSHALSLITSTTGPLSSEIPP